MPQIDIEANGQIERLNSRIAEVAADYERSELKRTIWLRAGNIRRASEISRRLRVLSTELASLASQRRQWDRANLSHTRH